MIRALSAGALERLIKDKKEKEFLIVDVRQLDEYRLDHIPGATHIPLAEIQFDPFVFDDGRDLIFYCRTSSRSKVAALFAEEAGYDQNHLYYLKGGMFEYTGEILLDMPRVDLFPSDVTSTAIMEKAIDFEKGAYYFYSFAKEKFDDAELVLVMEKMQQAEVSHAKSIYNQLKKSSDIELEFDLYFERCRGEILEGGKSLSEINDLLFDKTSDDCGDIVDFAIELEFSAYDLYKTMAENSNQDQESAVQMFYTLAQAEKRHLEQMVKALSLCGNKRTL